jgi:cytochrome c
LINLKKKGVKMYKQFLSVLAVGGLMIAQPAAADQAMAQAQGCMACHQVEVKVVGPSYKEVAAKYKDDAAARDLLIGKVRAGGVGTWGQIPMPPNTTASDEDLAALIDWIMGMGG